MEISQQTRSRFILIIGLLIFLQAGLGLYFIIKGETTNATVSFSTLAALAASMASLSAGSDDTDDRSSDRGDHPT